MLLVLCSATMLLFGSIQAFSHTEANEYIERVLNGPFQVEAEYSRLDPYRLEDFKVPVNHTGKQRGWATLTKGRLIHLSKVRRSADCSVPHWESANVTFTCFLKFDQLRINYTANATFDNINVIFYPHVAIRDTNITVQVTSNTQEDIPTMKLMFINRVGHMNVTAQMIAIGDSADIVGVPVREGLIRFSNKYLHEALNGRFRNALRYSIYKTPLGFLSK